MPLDGERNVDMNELEQYREQIDALDAELLRLFVQRMETARAIGEYKRQNGLPVTDEQRRQQILEAARTQCPPQWAQYAEKLFETLTAAERDCQHSVCGSRAESYSGFGLLGENPEHSCLPLLHTFYGEYEYRLFATAPSRLEAFVRAADFRGVNVAAEYQQEVIPCLDELSELAERTRSVTLIVKNAAGRLVGHNTDYDGFAEMMKYEGVSFAGKSVMILGDGAASRTLAAYAEDNGARCVHAVGSSGPLDYEHAYEKRDTQIIVNTTPIGRYPDNDSLPIDISAFMALETVIDTIHNPLRTRLYSEAEKLGVRAVGGLYMLVAQAKRSAELFCGLPVEHARMAEVYAKMTRRLQNIVLIGMPGCGKSSIGKRLARLLGKQHVDTDKLVAERAQKSIEDVFAEDGEPAFRELESAVIAEVSGRGGCVISTGGGSVLRGENVDRLKQNGKLVWIDRAVSALEISDRHLLTDPESVKRLYAQRRPIYQSAADLIVKNRTSTQIAAKEIAKMIIGRGI